jgi:hypothetical protein
MTDNKIVKSVGTSGVDVEATGIDVDDSDNVTGINDLTIDGNLTVNGTTTSVNTDILDVEDANITVNKGGTQASADAADAGLTIEMSDATDVVIGYDSTLASKIKVGESGAEQEVVTTNHTQTLMNKSVNADNNTISELEVDNLKAGVLETDLNNAVDNTKLAGAQAIKDYVASELALQDDASEISYSPATAADYDVLPTHVDGALDELADRVNTTEDNLSTHLGAGSGKHAASQITNTPAGNIAATEVQAAINELDTEKYVAANFDGDFDTRLATKSTSDIAEGTNEYYTTEKAQDAVGTILTDSASIDLNYDDASPQITATVLPAGVDHDSLANYIGAEHVDHGSVSITGAGGLGGGGNIALSRSISLDYTTLATAPSLDPVNDDIVIYDADTTSHRKIKVSQISSVGSSAGDISEGSFSLAQSAVSAPITGFAFANVTVRSFQAVVSVEIDATADLFEEIQVNGIQKGSDWEITIESVGDDSLIELDIDATGQVIYSSSTYTGFVSGAIKFRALTTSI